LICCIDPEFQRLLDFGFFHLLFSHWGSVNLFLAKKNSGQKIENPRFNCVNLKKKNGVNFRKNSKLSKPQKLKLRIKN